MKRSLNILPLVLLLVGTIASSSLAGPRMPPQAQMMANVAERCKKGDAAACEQMKAFGMGYSNYAQKRDQDDREALTKLCNEKKKEACDLLKKLPKPATK